MTEHYSTFISLITEKRTYDLKFKDRNSTIDFYMAVNKCMHLVKPKY